VKHGWSKLLHNLVRLCGCEQALPSGHELLTAFTCGANVS